MKTSKSRPSILTRIIAPAIVATSILLLPANSGGQSCCGGGGSSDVGGALSLGNGPRILQLHLKAPSVPKRLLIADVTHGKILYNKVLAQGAGQTQISVRLKVPKNAIIKTRYIEPYELNDPVLNAPNTPLPEAFTFLVSSAGTMRIMSKGGPGIAPSSTFPTTDNSTMPEGTITDTASETSSGESEQCPGPRSEMPNPYFIPPYGGFLSSYEIESGILPSHDADGSGNTGETSGESAGNEAGDGDAECEEETDEYDPNADNDLSDDGDDISGDGGDGGNPETEGNVSAGTGDHGGVNIKMSLGAISKKSFGNLSLALKSIGPATTVPTNRSSFDWNLLQGAYNISGWPELCVYANSQGFVVPLEDYTGIQGYNKVIPTAAGFAAIKNIPVSANVAGYAVDYSQSYVKITSADSNPGVQKVIGFLEPTSTWLFGCPDATSLATIPTSILANGATPARSPKLRVVKGKFRFGRSQESLVTEYYQETQSRAWVMTRSKIATPLGTPAGSVNDYTVGSVQGYANGRKGIMTYEELFAFEPSSHNIRVANPVLLTSASDGVIESGKYEVVTKWAENGSGGRRTLYTSRATRANNASPWKSHIHVVSVGPEAGAPTPQSLETSLSAAYPGSTTSVTVIGNIPNGHWRWTSKGWETRIISGSVAAPTYKSIVLKANGNQPSPIGATHNNSDATITDHATLDRFTSTVVERKLGGNRVSYVVNAKSGNVAGEDLHTTVRQTGTGQWQFSSRTVYTGGTPLAGRPKQEVSPDGTVTNYAYEFGSWDTGTYTFAATLPSEIRLTPEDGGIKITRSSTAGDGIVRVSIFDEDRRLVREERSKDGIPIDAIINEYDSVGNLTFKYREDGAASGAWRTIYAATFDATADGTPTSMKLSETDAEGITTTFANLNENQPMIITRPALPAIGDIPAVPKMVTTLGYDEQGRRTLEEQRADVGSPVLSSRGWKYDSDGRLVLEKVNGLVTQYAYQTLTDGTHVELRYGPGGAAQNETANLATLTPSSTTTYLADGRLKSITGPGVVAETHNYSVGPDGFLVTEVVRGSGTAAAPTAETSISRTRTDWVGRRIGEMIQTPGSLNHWRTVEYDGSGRISAEKVDGMLKRSYAYPDTGMLTVNTSAAPDPDRADSKLQSLTLINGVWWQGTSSERGISRRKVSGLTGNLLSHSESTDAEGRKSTVTETLESAGTVLTVRTVDGVTNAAMSRRRAGITVWENSPSVPEPVITTVDPLGRPTYVNHTGMQVGTTITYDPTTGQVSTVVTASTAVAGSATQSEVRTYYPAGATQPGPFPYRLATRHVNGHPVGQYTYYTARGEVWAEYGAAYPVRYTYDAVGRMKKMETYQVHPGSGVNGWPAGNPTTWVYHAGTDLLQTKLDAANVGPIYTYDTEGRLSTRTWARGVEASYYYNNAGELRVIDYSDTTPDVTVTRNNKGRISTVQDGTGVKAYAFGASGGLESETQFDVAGAEVASLNYTKDAVGRRSGYGYWDSVSGVWTTWQGWSHEAETGRVDGIGTPGGWFDYTFKPGSDWLWKTDFSGQVTTTRTPDELWRLSNITTLHRDAVTGVPGLASPLASHTYAYNARHERWKATQGDGSFWQYSYDDLGQVTGGDKHLLDATAYPGYDFDYEYDSIGNRTKAWTNGRRRDYTSNALNQYTMQRERNPDGTPTTIPNKADVVGLAGAAATGVNVNGVAATMATLPGGKKAFHGLTDTGVLGTGRAAYRAVTVEELNPPAAPTGVNGAVYVPPAYLTAGRTNYDLDGNLVTDDRFVYLWDAENRLVEVRSRTWHYNTTAGLQTPANQPFERTVHTYDAFWRLVKSRVEEKPSTTGAVVTKSVDLFAYDGWNIIAEWSGEGINRRIVRTNHWGLDLSGTFQGAGGVGGLLQCITGTGTATYSSRAIEHPFYDGNGNIMGSYNTANWGPMPQQLLAEHEYDPFGRRIRTTGSSPTLPYRFSTKREDARTGLNYYGYRWYQASTGRWVSRDTYEERGGANLYGMVMNKAISFIDILGREPSGPTHDDSGPPSLTSGITPEEFTIILKGEWVDWEPGTKRKYRDGSETLLYEYSVESEEVTSIAFCQCNVYRNTYKRYRKTSFWQDYRVGVSYTKTVTYRGNSYKQLLSNASLWLTAADVGAGSKGGTQEKILDKLELANAIAQIAASGLTGTITEGQLQRLKDIHDINGQAHGEDTTERSESGKTLIRSNVPCKTPVSPK